MKKKINFKPYITSGIISLLLGIFIFILFFLILKRPAMDGTAFAAIILISSAGLIWVGREGFFDIFSYGIRQFSVSAFSKKPNELNNFAEYKEYKYEMRHKRSKYYISFALIGVIFLIATIILYIIYKL